MHNFFIIKFNIIITTCVSILFSFYNIFLKILFSIRIFEIYNYLYQFLLEDSKMNDNYYSLYVMILF